MVVSFFLFINNAEFCGADPGDKHIAGKYIAAGVAKRLPNTPIYSERKSAIFLPIFSRGKYMAPVTSKT